MEDKSGRMRWLLITAVAPIAWGSSYVVTHQLLPPDAPLWGALLRALPAGLILLALSRRLPRGSWWWRSLLLGAVNVGGFFVLIYITGQRLASGLAATLMSSAALVMMLFAWALLHQRPRLIAAIGAFVGLLGVAIMMGVGGGPVDGWGVAASLAAMVASSFGFILTARWGAQVPAITMSSWQLVGGALLLIPVALVLEGPPPTLTPSSTLGFVYLTVVATAVAYAAWFTGLRRLPASVVGVVGLLNPVTGVALGVAIGGEAFGVPQGVGLGLVLAGIGLGSLPARRSTPAGVTDSRWLPTRADAHSPRTPNSIETPSTSSKPAVPPWRRDAGPGSPPRASGPIPPHDDHESREGGRAPQNITSKPTHEISPTAAPGRPQVRRACLQAMLRPAPVRWQPHTPAPSKRTGAGLHR
jgi:drug/metabolite transporter (DMT)-like permease